MTPGPTGPFPSLSLTMKFITLLAPAVAAASFLSAPVQARPMINDYTIGKAMKEVKCGRRDLASTSRWFGQMGVTNSYLNGPAMASVEFHKGYMYGSKDC